MNNMGRELKRKEEKRNKGKKKNQEEEEISTEINGVTIAKVVGAIVLILLVVYYILAVFVTKEIDISEVSNNKDKTSDSEVNSSVSNKILASNIFSQKEEIYYVYCYNFDDEDEGVAEAVNGATDKKIYRLDTNSSLNSKYVTDENGNVNATSLNDLSISSPTLLEIAGDRITGYYEGRSNIINYLSK